MKLVRVAFLVPTSEAEIARAWFVEHAPAGFEERVDGERTELAVYVAPDAAGPITAAFPLATVAEVPDGWEDGWKRFHRAVVVGGLWVGPPWIEPPPDLPAVVVDPGRAFGTGAHPTTRACIEALSRLEPGSLFDAGCGSGVVAVEVAAETALRNEVEVDVRQADVLRDPLPQSDVAVANIELAVVEQLLGRLDARLAVTSGYLDPERPAAPGWESVDRVQLEGWAADVLARRQ